MSMRRRDASNSCATLRGLLVQSTVTATPVATLPHRTAKEREMNTGRTSRQERQVKSRWRAVGTNSLCQNVPRADNIPRPPRGEHQVLRQQTKGRYAANERHAIDGDSQNRSVRKLASYCRERRKNSKTLQVCMCVHPHGALSRSDLIQP